MIEIELEDEAATTRLGAHLAALARPRDVFALSGTLGVGKTVLARSFIGTLTGETEVPSPTFTLVQTYRFPDATIWHFDLYRFKSSEEIWEIGFEDALAEGISLIEWPERLGSLLPASRLDIHLFVGPKENSRSVRLLPIGRNWATRLESFPQL